MEKTFNKRVVISCFLASCFEIYDFVIFSFFAKDLHKNFFIFLSQDAMQMVTYVLLGIGFVFRPIGSLIFGYIGDIYGRKKALLTSVSLMGSCSIIMFLLPSYNLIGASACFVIVVVRILQGLSVGGEFSGAIIYAIEYTPSKYVGFVGGVMAAGGACGVLMANQISLLVKSFDVESGWRLAFLVGAVLTFVGFFIRKNLGESPDFAELREQIKQKQLPILVGIREKTLECFATIFMAAANGSSFYFAVIFLPNFLRESGVDGGSVLPIIMPILLLVFGPTLGFLSEKLGRLNTLIVCCLAMSCYLIILMNNIQNTENQLILFMVYGILLAGVATMSNTFTAEMFPVEFRMSCTGFFYSIGMGVIGGTVPMVSEFIVKNIGNDPVYIAYYIGLICFISAAMGFAIKIKLSKYRLY